MLRRRDLILLLGHIAAQGLVIVAPLAKAQPSTKMRRIGFLGDGTRADRAAFSIEPFREGLQELGYSEGRNILIEERWSDGKQDRRPALVRELIELDVAVIVTHGVLGSKAAQAATRNIPIIFGVAPDPVAAGLVASLAWPGGNVTGLTDEVPDFAEKEIQILREIVPGLVSVAILWNKANPGARPTFEETRKAVEKSGLKFTVHVASEVADLDSAIEAAAKEHSGGLVVVHDVFTVNNRTRIAEGAIRYRLPSISASTPYVAAGGLVAYGVNYADQFRNAARYVDKILKGAKPSELPVEQPTKFELVINLKTAKALGITIPQDLRLRADEVIQ
jgi:putative ABC transport system substrate-binding protein